jgi:NAD(P)H-hydrate repair Nnr-like enzyme with NAD(P)H-hydrate epimerase domain/8-oxo-dGTP pyrophosphatase MutT (NUDIX family)
VTPLPDARAFRAALEATLDAVPAEEREAPSDGRVGAVLVLFAEGAGGGIDLVLTRRRRDLRSHPGQVAFPGGRVDDEDHDAVATALREAAEEIALRPASVDVIGAGRTFYLPPSRFWVAPVIGWWADPHPLVANPDEVDEVLHVSLATLLDHERWRNVPLSAGGSTWAWQLEEDLLWGATAIVAAQLLRDVLGDWSGGVGPDDLGQDRAVRPWEDAPPWTPRTRLDRLPAVPVDVVTPVGRRGLAAVLTELGPERIAGVAGAAARAVVRVVAELLGGLEGHEVTVLVGPAGTGRVGLDVARRLRTAGVDVTVRLAEARADVDDLPDHVVVPPPTVVGEVRLDRRTGIAGAPPVPEVDRPAGDLVVDALLGPGAEPPLHGGPAALALWAARTDLPVVAIALPSGVSADTGLTGPSLHADVTVTLGMPTAGLFERIVAPYAGELVVADVGIPPEVWAAAGIEVPDELFAEGSLVRLDRGAVASDAGTPDQGPPVR